MERRNNMPLWVFLGLANINSRRGALTLIGASLISSFICIPISYYFKDWSWAIVMFAITLWYWLCLRWVDKHTGWESG